MADLVSPGIQIKELDLTTTVVGASNSAGAIGIVSEKGPHDEIVTVTTEDELVSVFGKPNASSFEWFFTAAAFLKYSGVLRVVRIETGVLNAVGGAAGLLIKNTDHFYRDAIAPCTCRTSCPTSCSSSLTSRITICPMICILN